MHGDELIRHGYELFPLRPDTKTPLHKGWRTSPALTTAECAAYAKVGVRLTAAQLVVDVDWHAGRPRGSVAALRSISADVDVAPMVVTRNGLHLYFAMPPGFSGKLRHTLKDFPGTEFKTIGRYVVAPGCVGYDWDPLGPELPAPIVPDSILQLLLVKSINADLAAGEWSPGELAEALQKLDATQFREHDKWFALMCASHEATAGAGLAEFVAWSTSDNMYADHNSRIAARWQSFVAGRLGNAGVGTLLKTLAEHGVNAPESVVARAAVADFGELGDGVERGVIEPSSLMDKMSRWFRAVDEDGKLRVYARRHDETLERKYWVRYARRDFLEVTKSVMHLPMVQCGENAKGDPRYEEAGAHWLDHYHAKKTYRGLVFAPEHASDRTPGGKLNLWQGFAAEPSVAGSWEMLKELTWETLCDGDTESYEYVMSWMARAVQRPWEPGGVALVFRGPKGTGKGTLARTFCKLFGQHGLHITSQTLLVGRFNVHLRDVCALFADEAFWAGDKTGESVLKGLITEPTLAYEGKGENVSTGRNCIHVMMASNEDWVVPAGMDKERRFAVFNVRDDQHDKRYWDRLHSELSLPAMLYDLQSRDVAAFNPFSVPHNGALAEQKLRSMNIVASWLYESARNEWMDFGEPHSGMYSTEEVHASYLRHCDAQNVRGARSSKTILGLTLKKYLTVERRRVMLEGSDRQIYMYELPEPDAAVRQIEQLLGFAYVADET